ncbi:M13 family metallopeptidase [bacterium]|nr:M13 family metallopeptidase [bacterium]
MKLNKIIILSLVLAACGSETEEKEKVKNEGPVAFDVSQIDSTIDPCDNFYKFAIGSWQKNNPVPSTESRWMAFNILDKANKEKLQGILENVKKKEGVEAGSEEQMIRDFYISALDTNNLKSEGLEVISPYIQMIDELSSKEELPKTFSKLSPLGVRTPLWFGVSRDEKNSERYITSLNQSGLSLPDRDYYLRTDEKSKTIREKYINHVHAMFEMSGMDVSDAGNKVMDVESKLALSAWSRTQLRDPDANYNKNAVSEWDKKFRNISIRKTLDMYGLSEADTLIIGQPSYFNDLDKYIGNISIENWKAYLKWQVINSYANYLGDDFESEHFAFFATELRGTKEMKSRKERILNVLNGSLGEPLGKLYVKEYFPEESKEYMIEMIENLRSAYRDRIENLSWMSAETKKKALKKLNAFTYKIGYPDKWEDYSTLSITDKNYAENVMNARIWSYNDMISKLGQPVDKDEWFMNPQMVNAYYSSSGNEIVFPAGILQPPFFHPTFDHAINYGGIGAVIGHEFTHGFDDQGSKYDWNGNLNNWWTDEDRIAFDALATQLAKQYSSYSPIDTMHVNGRLTLGENIADLGGITLAYEALKKAYDGNYPEPIDGFTWQQRFFLGWANVWKGNITDEELRNRLITDPHSPAEYRGNGPLVNFDPYYEAFGACTEGAMYKPDSSRIKIW